MKKIHYLLFIFLIFSLKVLCAGIQQSSTLIKGVLPNGLTYYIYPNNYPRGEAVYRLFVKSGSVNETNSQRGLAHFLEHMAFNGTKNFPGNKMVRFLESRGAKFGKDLNAHTSFNETVFKLQLPSKDHAMLDSTMTILADWAAGGLLLDSMEIESERGVVLSEWLSRSGPEAEINNALLMELLNGSRYSQRIVIGDTAVIRNFKKPELAAYYRDWYRPDLMAVAVAGDVDVAEVEKQLKEKFGRIPRKNGGKLVEYSIAPYKSAEAKVMVNKSLTKAELNVMQLLPIQEGVKTEKAYRTYLSGLLLNRLIKARLNALSFDNPAYLKADGSVSRFLNAGMVTMATVELDTLKLKEGITEFITALNQMRHFGFLRTEILKQKRIYLSQLKRKAVSKLPVRSDEIMDEIYSDYFVGNVFTTPQEEYRLAQKYIDKIDSMSMLERMKTVVKPEKMHYLLTTYSGVGSLVESNDSLMAFINHIYVKKPLPYSRLMDSVPDELLEKEPQVATILQRKMIAEIGAEELDLSNGVKVIFKHSVTDKDKITISAFRKTGSYSLPASDYVSSLVAGNVVALSGAGRFSRDALSYYLAGNSASVRFLIDKTRSGVFGSASMVDIETLFSLMYLKWNFPKVDSKIFTQTKEKSIQEYKTSNKTEESVFYEEFSRLLKKTDYTTRELTDTVLTHELNEDRILPIFNHCFGAASGYTFVVMGDCELSDCEAYILRYIGGLPAGNVSENYVYEGGMPNLTSAILKRKAGDSPKAVVSLVFQQTDIRGRLSAFNLQNEIAAAVLKMRLLKELREKMGMVYSVGVSSGATLYPAPLSRNSISFRCLPENAELLIDKIKILLVQMQKAPENFEKELSDVKVNLIKSYELDKQKDSFWASSIRNTLFNKEDSWSSIVDYPQIVQSVSVGQIAYLFGLNYNMDTAIESILLPKK